MTGLCNPAPACARHRGAALIVALTLIAAVGLLATAATREAIVETAMTRNLALHTQARYAATSAIESALGEASLPLSGQTVRSFRLGPARQFEATVTIVRLGALPAPAPAAPGSLEIVFEVTAEVTGPRNTGHRRKRYVRVNDSGDPPVR